MLKSRIGAGVVTGLLVFASVLTAQTVEECMKTAKDPKLPRPQRAEAIKALAGLADKDKAVPDLADLLRDGDLAPHAAAVLGQTTAVRLLSDSMKDPQAKEVEGRFSYLVRARVPGAIEECVALLSSPEYLARRRALNVLASIRGFHQMQHAMIVPALPALLERAATDPSLQLRLDAVAAIGSFGKHSLIAVPGLADLLAKAPDQEVRLAAARALGGVGQAEGVTPLIMALRQDQDDLRYAAALSLSALGPAAVEALIAETASPSAGVRRYAAFALAKVGKDASVAMTALAEALRDKDELVRRNAADALGRLGEAKAVPLLAALADDPSEEVRFAASAALALLAPDDASARAAVEKMRGRNRGTPAYRDTEKGRRPASDGSTVFFPAAKVPLYPSHHGEPPGYPGCIPGEAKEDGTPKFPKWGNPEMTPYPGSVEHYRTEEIKYLPPWTLFNAASLLKNFRATELPEAAGLIEDYAEPVYYTPMYGQSRDTGKRNPPVKVVRARVGGPAFNLDLGALDVGLYVVRLIAAVEGNPTSYRKPLYVELRVNDLPGDTKAMQRYRLRVGYVDEFYSIAEFYFYAPEKRAYAATLAVGERSEVEPLIYNMDLHDAWAGCQLRPIKTRMTLHRPEERDAKRAQYRQRAEGKQRATYHCGAFGYWQPFATSPLPPEERIRRDRALWDSLPPLNRNSGPGYSDQPIADDDGWRVAGGFLDAPALRNDALGLRYANDDFLNFRVLPDPYPRKDDGGAVSAAADKDAKYPRTFLPIARMVGQRIRDYTLALNGLAAHHPGLADVYFETGDTAAARDAAMMLVRAAWFMPTADSGRQQVTMAIAGNTTDLQWGGKDHWTRRRLNRQNRGSAAVTFMSSYDKLYDYIKDNQEFAAAVRRFMPWVRTPDDVIAFLDCSYQHYVKRCVHWHYDAYGGMSESIIAAATEVGDWPFTKPWMDWLFRETWKYPNARAGLPDYATTSTTRDGTSYIGSWAYAQDRPALDYAKMTQAYIRAGGFKEFDLSDPKQYPKALQGCYFDFDGRAAGLHYLGVGDVGGPAVPHGHWFGDNDPRMRLGWQWSRDPKFAWALAHYYGRKAESDAEWAEIEAAAKKADNPWFTQKSRVLSSWGGILESGTEHSDYRFRRAVMVRLGYGWGHQHDDTLDLLLWCHGLIHAADGGERPEKRNQDEVKGPADQKSYIHNVVEVDGDGSHRSGDWRGHSWAAALKDTAGARYLDAVAAPGVNHPHVRVFRRQVALVDIDEGRPSKDPPKDFKAMLGRLDPDIVAPEAYVFDVFRVAGGRRHTYCFHGPSADEFKSNAVGVQEVPWGNADTPDGLYLKNFICPDNRTAGKAPLVLDAAWRLRREVGEVRAMRPAKAGEGAATHEAKVVFRTGNAEQAMLRDSYDPASPRKYTRLHLFGHEGGRVLTGRWIASAPAIAFDCLYAQRDAAEGQERLESVFPAVIQMYAGEPVVVEGKLLTATPNEGDALRAAAVELRLHGDRADVCFSDGRPDQARRLENGMTVSGEFAFYSQDRAGLRQATLAGGTTLGGPGVSISVASRERRAKITEVNYLDRSVRIDQPWPRLLLDGQTAEVGSAKRRTTYTIKAVSPDGAGAVVSLDKGMDYCASRVKGVDEEKGEVLCGLALPMDDGAVFPGLSDDVVVSNADATRCWRGQYLGGTREDGYRFKLEGVVRQADFGGGKLRVWEIGVGDEVRVPTHVSLRRAGEGRYELTADTALRLTLPGVSTMRLTPRGQGARELAKDKDGAFALTEAGLGVGVVALETAK